jgi:hypothetical protein
MMKRIISAIIACVILLSVCSCTPTISIVGTWEYDNNYGLKDLVSDQIDDAYFYKVYYQFNEDGTGKTWTSYSPDYKAEFTYEFDGYKLTVDLDNGSKQSLDVDLQRNQFTISDGKEEMVFIRVE